MPARRCLGGHFIFGAAMGHRRGESRQQATLFPVLLDELVLQDGAVRSSRSLERECHRNIECMWLLGRLAPDHKTIADFRRVNTQALVAVCAAFVQFARSHRLIVGSTVAVDGSKVRAVASRKAVIGKRELVARAQSKAQQIEAYLRLLDVQDGQEAGPQPSAEDV